MLGFVNPCPTATIKVAPSNAARFVAPASAARPTASVPRPARISLRSPNFGTNLRINPPCTTALISPRYANANAASLGPQLNRLSRNRLNVASSAANAKTARKPRLTSEPIKGCVTVSTRPCQLSTREASRRPARDSGNLAMTKIKANVENPAPIRNGSRSRHSVGKGNDTTTPASNGPRTNPTPNAMPIRPSPRARCSGGVTSAT